MKKQYSNPLTKLEIIISVSGTTEQTNDHDTYHN